MSKAYRGGSFVAYTDIYVMHASKGFFTMHAGHFVN